jgi:hypothetical protein
MSSLNSSITHNVKAEDSEPLFARHRVLFTDTPSVVVFVEVINNGSTAVRNVNVTVTFYDNQGNTIAQIDSETLFEVIMPQRRTPLFVSLYDADAVRYGTTGRYEVSITHYELSEDVDQSIVIIPEVYELTERNVTVIGKVYNNGSSVLGVFEVVGLFYEGSDDEEKPKGYRAHSDPYDYVLSTPLQPGGITEESFTLFSGFADNASDKLACIITAEARERVGNQTQNAATVQQEVLIWLKGGPESPIESFDYRWVVLAVILTLTILAGIMLLNRRKRKKTRLPKNVAESRIVRFSTPGVTDRLLFFQHHRCIVDTLRERT